ncbi:MAG: hypothetical protein U0353_13370 [Sandaracinus sp.]
MAYRDDTDALRARVAELEQKLSLSEALVEKLLGRGPGTTTRKPDSLVGEVVHAVDEATFDVSLDAEALEALARVARERLGLAIARESASVRGTRTTNAWLGESPADSAFGVASNEHGASLRLETDLRRLPVIVALGPVLGIMLAVPLVLYQGNELQHFRETVSLGVSASVVLLSMLFGTLASRVLASRLARRARELHQGVWAAMLEIVRREGKLARVRVEAPLEETASSHDDAILHARGRKEHAR